MRALHRVSWPGRVLRAALMLGVVAGNVGLVAEPSASAQNDSVLAEVLFQDAKKLMADGDYAAACPKLAESFRIDPGNGTRLALAVCYERQGKTASAWGLFTDVVAAARRENRSDRESIARSHIGMLEPKLSRLVIEVSASTAQVPGLEIKRDGVLTARAAWGTSVPVDPGPHLIEASAPGRKHWQSTVTVGAKGERMMLTVPLMEVDSVVPPPSVATSVPMSAPASDLETSKSVERSPSNTRRTVGWIIGGVGVASLGVGAVFGVRAMNKSSEAKSLCSSDACANAEAINTNSDAKTAARIADITLGAGLIAVVGGTYLILSSPRRAASPSTKNASILTPTFDRYGAGLSLQRTW